MASTLGMLESPVDGARHEIFNETNRDEVQRHAIAWLDARR